MRVRGEAEGVQRGGDCIPLGLALRNAESVASQRPHSHLPPLRSEQHFERTFTNLEDTNPTRPMHHSDGRDVL